MDEIYKVTSTERIQTLEKKIGCAVTELKSKIEEQGTLLGRAQRAYSSVRIPKDISYYTRESKLPLKKTLQVAESKPLVIQADVVQRELESCLRSGYTPENLTSTSLAGPAGMEAAFILRQHMTEGELKSQLRHLLSHFNIPYDVEELRDDTKETELFPLVLDVLFPNTNIGVHERKC